MEANGTPTSTSVAIRDPIVAPAVMTDREIDQTFRVAKALAMSGLFKDTKAAEQAFAKILVGRDLGLSPTQAMMGIHIIEGKPELSANLQAAFVKRTPGYDFKVTEHTTEACTITFYRDGEEIGQSRFTMEDAKTAGLAGKGPWKSYPRNMLYARAMSNGVAFHCPEVTGGVRVYSEGEISGDEQPPAVDAAPAAVAEIASPVDVPPEAEVVEPAAAEPTPGPTPEPPAPAGMDPKTVKQLDDELNRFTKAGGEYDEICLQAAALGGELDDNPDAPNLWHRLDKAQARDLFDFMYDWVQAQAAQAKV